MRGGGLGRSRPVDAADAGRAAMKAGAGLFAALLAVLTMDVASASSACGGPDTPCSTELGSYHIVLPEGDGPHPAFIYFHGAGGSGRNIGDAEFARTLNRLGYAVIAPNGLERPESRFGPGWYFLPSRPARRDELAFTREIIAHAGEHHDVDGSTVVLTGYSIGGSLVWYLACKDADLAVAYTPYAGGFWRPHPEDCDGPVKLLHTHGWRDQTVPLEGRPLSSGRIYQGDIFEGLQQWREENSCTLLRADEFDTDGRYWRRRWTSCAPGTALELALWPGGHVRPDGEWAEMAVAWLQGVLDPAADVEN